jgi:CheY-like chemotaxis protein
LITDASSARTELFHAFSKIWNSFPLNGSAEPDETLPADRRIEQLSALPRQAFLLVSLESFSEEEAAYVLDVDNDEIRHLIDQCGQELANQIATDVLIIEDEALIAMDLESVVENLGHNVVGVARTRTEAIEIVKKKRPGLILADIQLADGSSGLDAVNDLLASFTVPVIFITAYPERFLTGVRPEPAFLIAKPYKPAVVSAIISQVLFFKRNATTQPATV